MRRAVTNLGQAALVLVMAVLSLTRRSFIGSTLALAAAAQDPSFSTTVKVVNVFASVHNKKGVIVRDLTKDDFSLEEDG